MTHHFTSHRSGWYGSRQFNDVTLYVLLSDKIPADLTVGEYHQLTQISREQSCEGFHYFSAEFILLSMAITKNEQQ